MKKSVTILNKEFEYDLILIPNQYNPHRLIRYNDKELGTVTMRGTNARDGYKVINRDDILTGHTMSGLAQYLILEYLFKQNND